jgi:hypothetical protein
VGRLLGYEWALKLHSKQARRGKGDEKAFPCDTLSTYTVVHQLKTEAN